MSDALLVPLVVASFLVVFPAFWCGVCWLIGATGWQRLADRYRSDARPDVPEHRVASATSARIGLASYNGVLRVGVSPEGLHLSVMALFRVGHPPLLVPWSEIEASPPRREWLRDVCELHLGRPHAATITLPAHVLDDAAEAIAAMRAGAAEHDAEAGRAATAARTGTRS